MNELARIRQNIKSLAKDFSLEYKKKLYQVNFIPQEDVIILIYLVGCPDPVYAKFGRTVKERIKNICEFLQSAEFARLSKTQGGSVVGLSALKKSVQKIKDNHAKQKCKNILKKLKRLFKGKAIIIASPKTKAQKKFALNCILFHEWIHILLMSNRIYFQNKKKEYWPLDEGLTTYMQTFFENKNKDTSKIIKHGLRKKGFFRVYAKNALKFSRILKDKNTPVERKKAILGYYKQV